MYELQRGGSLRGFSRSTSGTPVAAALAFGTTQLSRIAMLKQQQALFLHIRLNQTVGFLDVLDTAQSASTSIRQWPTDSTVDSPPPPSVACS